MQAFKVDLFALKNLGGSASATIDLGRASALHRVGVSHHGRLTQRLRSRQCVRVRYFHDQRSEDGLSA